MPKKLRNFLIGLILSLPLWWGINVLQMRLMKAEVFTASLSQQGQITEQLKQLRPAKSHQATAFELEAKAGAAVFFGSDRKMTLFEKNPNQKLPLASLSKLMTAKVVKENYDLEKLVKVSKKAVDTEGDFVELKVGEKILVKNLLYPLLIESSNDAAQALAQIIGQDSFVSLMNLESQYLGLENTHFENPTGLDPEYSKKQSLLNYSTARDLINLSHHLLKQHPEIFEITTEKEFELVTLEGLSHQLSNNNILLDQRTDIIGGKTGFTDQARGCLLIITKVRGGHVISVILGSEQRFKEMENLLTWIEKSYVF